MMEKTIESIIDLCNEQRDSQGMISLDKLKTDIGLLIIHQSKVNNGVLDGVSKRTFKRNDADIEEMACEIDKFIKQVIDDEKAGTYFRKLTEYLADKFNKYVC